jgi:multiple RNA-binding domain-containing protein 1
MEALKRKEQNVEKGEKSLPKDISEHSPLIFFTVKIRGLGYKHTRKHIKQFFHPLKPDSIRIPPKIKGIAYIGFKKEQTMKKALMKNKSFLGKRKRFKYD